MSLKKRESPQTYGYLKTLDIGFNTSLIPFDNQNISGIMWGIIP